MTDAGCLTRGYNAVTLSKERQILRSGVNGAIVLIKVFEMDFIYTVLAGALGVGARWWIASRWALTLPIATLTVNTLGSFGIGVIWAARYQLPAPLSSAASVGFLGGFTTLSAFSLDTVRLLQDSRPWWALAYFVATPVFGVIGAAAGVACTRWVSFH